jgi:hypothetical protein
MLQERLTTRQATTASVTAPTTTTTRRRTMTESTTTTKATFKPKTTTTATPTTTTPTTTAMMITRKAGDMPPKNTKQLNQFQCSAGEICALRIHDDTFTGTYCVCHSVVINCIDAEDGNTQSMKLQVEANGDDTTEWLHISENKQWMTGLTLKTGKHSFRLGATDSSGQSAYDAFVVRTLSSLILQHI